MKVIAAVVCLAMVALAGCTGGAVVDEEEDLPSQIRRQDIERLEQLATAQFPNVFAFPGQQVLEPVITLIEGTVGALGGTGLEPIDDDGPADFMGEVLAWDIAEMTPVGQPVELRLKLKWGGDPGASADLDIFVDVPGHHGAYDPGKFDESWNWNRVTKSLVVNTVRLDGEPFQVGVQAQNGKVVHPAGMDFTIEVQAHFPPGPVLPPHQPYALTLPPGGTGFILESEPVIGDEHITTELIIIGPDDRIHRAIVHNDIGTETLFITATRPGEYVFYVAYQHGGFLRVESDVPNPDFMARTLAKTTEKVSLAATAVLAPSLDPEGYGDQGAIEFSQAPLDLRAYIEAGQAASANADILVALHSEEGIVHSLHLQGGSLTSEGRLGPRPAEVSQRELMRDGEFTYGLRGHVGVGTDVGYIITGYQR